MISGTPSRVKRFRELLTIEHPLTVAAVLFRKLCSYLVPWDVHRFYSCDLDSTLSADPFVPGIEITLYAAPHDFKQVEQLLAGSPLHPETISTRLALGYVLAVARCGEQLAGYTWASFRPTCIKDAGLLLIPKEDEAVQYDSFVMPPFRRRGLHRALHLAMLHWLRNRGYKRAFSWANRFNSRSLKTQAHLGKRRLFTLFWISLVGMKRPWTFTFGATREGMLRLAPLEPINTNLVVAKK